MPHQIPFQTRQTMTYLYSQPHRIIIIQSLPPSQTLPNESNAPHNSDISPPPPLTPLIPPAQSLPRKRHMIHIPALPPQHECNYNERGVGMNMKDSLNGMGLSTGVTVHEVNVRYRNLACQLHPDKHDPVVSGMTSEEAVELFKLINNAQQFLQATICR